LIERERERGREGGAASLVPTRDAKRNSKSWNRSRAASEAHGVINKELDANYLKGPTYVTP
jgi:hypothetical protein